MADLDSPIAMEAMRATRVLHAADQEPFPAPNRIRVITIANQKGGVGKTTSTVNLGVALALYGLRTLVIDLDPQGNASTALGVEHTWARPRSTTPWSATAPLAEVVHPTTASPKLRLRARDDRPGRRRDRAGLRRRPRAPAAPGHRGLRRDLPAAERPHYVLIDCPPSLGLLTLNALVAGDEVLIPIQCEYYALEGLGQLLSEHRSRARAPQSRDHGPLDPAHHVRRPDQLADQVADEVRNHFGELVLTSVIPRNVRVSEAPGYGQSVLTYDPGSRARPVMSRRRASSPSGARCSRRSNAPSPPGGLPPVPPVAALILGEPAAPTAQPSRTQESP